MECWRLILPWLCYLKKAPITDVTSELLISKSFLRHRPFLVNNVRMESMTQAPITWLWMSPLGTAIEVDPETVAGSQVFKKDRLIYPTHTLTYTDRLRTESFLRLVKFQKQVTIIASCFCKRNSVTVFVILMHPAQWLIRDVCSFAELRRRVSSYLAITSSIIALRLQTMTKITTRLSCMNMPSLILDCQTMLNDNQTKTKKKEKWLLFSFLRDQITRIDFWNSFVGII